MDEIDSGQTARILQFPVGGRKGRGRLATRKPVLEAVDIPVVDVSAGWYHDAAIRDSEPAHTR